MENKISEEIKFEGYNCGHKGKPIILDDNELSISAFYEWCESVGWKGDKSICWECWCKDKCWCKNKFSLGLQKSDAFKKGKEAIQRLRKRN